MKYYLMNIGKRLRKALIMFIPWLVLFLGSVYSVGEYYGWWDVLSKRKAVCEVADRLKQAAFYPEVIILNDDPGFGAFIDFVAKRTQSKIIIERFHNGLAPVAVTRAMESGGTDNSAERSWARYFAAPQTSRVLFLYSDEINHDPKPARVACTLSEIDEWVNRARNSERFYLSTCLLGLLSVFALLLKTPGQ